MSALSESIINTLPICNERGIAYSTFSILQVFNSGKAYLVEFDNPALLYFRKKKLIEVEKKEISICRGINNLLNYGVVDMNGNIVEVGTLIHENDFIEKEVQVLLYKTVKKICEIALKYYCEILTEGLSHRNDFLNFMDGEGILHTTPFKKSYYFELIRILKYKSAPGGLRKVLELSPLDIFLRCPACYTLSKRNRFNQDMFLCTSCGTLMDIDELGSINLARKLLSYHKTPIILKSAQLGGGIIL